LTSDCLSMRRTNRRIYVKRIHIYVSGVVQGVLFRHHTRERALGFGVTGWVRNLRDGRVEAVLEGEDDAIDRMIAFCKRGPPDAHVTKVEFKEESWTGEFKDFIVKR
jgi:acylphosphatase